MYTTVRSVILITSKHMYTQGCPGCHTAPETNYGLLGGKVQGSLAVSKSMRCELWLLLFLFLLLTVTYGACALFIDPTGCL